MSFPNFMASPSGRLLRVVAGGALIGVGLGVVQGVSGTVIAVVGLLPVATGILDLCIFGPLFGAKISGKKVRNEA